jgi:glucose uptake protein
MTQEFIWFFGLFIAIVSWGTWLSFSRNASNTISNPFHENLLITLGALIFNTFLFIGYSFLNGFSWFSIPSFFLPFISGILWSFAWLFAFLAISKIGVWKAFSIWAPSWMVVSFLWWILYYKEFSGNLLSALFAVILVIIGVFLVIQSKTKKDNNKLVFSWVLLALSASLIWWGTYLMPIKELQSHTSPFLMLLPLNIWMVVGSLITLFIKEKNISLPKKLFKQGFPLLFSGVLWALGNLWATVAVLNIWMWKAYPLAELCWVLNALIAVFILKEIQEKNKIILFLLGTAVSFTWAIWLAFLKI